MKRLIIFILLLFVNYSWAQDNSSWTHLGPFSNGNSGNGFEAGRIQCIAADPRGHHQTTYYAGSCGGVWETSSGGNSWIPLDPGNRMHYGGANAIAVGPLTGGVYIASTDISNHITWDSLYVFTPSTNTWVALTPCTTTPYKVDNIRFLYNNENVIYVCTTVGLFLSTNGGVSWTQVDATTEIYDIVYFVNGTTVNYYTAGNHVFKKSTNGVNFTDVTAVENTFNDRFGHPWKNMLGTICLGDTTTANKDMYILAEECDTSSTDVTAEGQIYKMTANTTSGTITNSVYYSQHEYDNSIDRIALTYANIDASDKLLIFGSVGLHYLNTTVAPPSGILDYSGAGSSGYQNMHGDQHCVMNFSPANYVLAGCDGGFSIFNYNSGYFTPGGVPYFSAYNTGLDIAQIVGFSGDNGDSTFIDGEQDTHGFMLSASSGNSNVWTWNEADGGMFDEFNSNIVIGLPDEYSDGYWFSTNHGASFYSNPIGISAKDPCGGAADVDTTWGYSFVPDYIPTPGATSFSAYLTPYATSEECEAGVWGKNILFQDPSRPNVMYHGNGTLNEWDSIKKVFAGKVSPFAIYSGYDSLHSIDWYGAVVAMGISPIYKNATYLTTACRSHLLDPAITPANEHASQVIMFNQSYDIDQSWSGHNEDATHWKEITPSINTLYGLSLTNEQLRGFQYSDVAISTWNPNKIWINCTAISGAPQVKVLQYDNGVWTDYSTGIPIGEYTVSMVSEFGSDDGLYLSTNRGVYYRNATMSSWQPYMNNIPRAQTNQMEINYTKNTIRAGTYGRGIWLSGLNCPGTSTETLSNTTNKEFDEVTQTIASTANITAAGVLPDGWPTEVNYRAGEYVSLNPGFYANAGSNFYAYIHPCNAPGNSSIRRADGAPNDIEEATKVMNEVDYHIDVYPNPNRGDFMVNLPTDEVSDIHVYNLLGSEIYNQIAVKDKVEINLGNLPRGIYFVKAIDNQTGKTDSKKVIIQ